MMNKENEQKFKNKIVIITGGARGIGKNIARAFCKKGAKVIICDVNQKAGKATLKEFRNDGISAELLVIDLGKRNAPKEMIKQTVNKYGHIDILINNARSGKHAGLLSENEHNWEDTMSVTLKAVFFASQEAVKHMKIARRGNIVNISSVGALLACRESPSYQIAKAGLIQMTRYFAVKAGEYGIRVNSILPGFIVQDEHREKYESKGNRQYKKIAELCQPIRAVGYSDDIANAALFLCSAEAAFITGQSLVVDGGLISQEQSTLLFDYINLGAKKK